MLLHSKKTQRRCQIPMVLPTMRRWPSLTPKALAGEAATRPLLREHQEQDFVLIGETLPVVWRKEAMTEICARRNSAPLRLIEPVDGSSVREGPTLGPTPFQRPDVLLTLSSTTNVWYPVVAPTMSCQQ